MSPVHSSGKCLLAMHMLHEGFIANGDSPCAFGFQPPQTPNTYLHASVIHISRKCAEKELIEYQGGCVRLLRGDSPEAESYEK